jgi:hypothetical protein
MYSSKSLLLPNGYREYLNSRSMASINEMYSTKITESTELLSVDDKTQQ